jgi:hypothetical protein
MATFGLGEAALILGAIGAASGVGTSIAQAAKGAPSYPAIPAPPPPPPEPPPAPSTPPPAPTEADAEGAVARERRKRAGAYGVANTLLGPPLGAGREGQVPGAGRSLLGSG